MNSRELIFLSCLAFFASSGNCVLGQEKLATLQFVAVHPKPLIKKGDMGTVDNKFGFEGGTCRKVNGKYYLFTTEIFDVPKTAAVRLAMWTSKDGLHFKKESVIAETNRNWQDTTNKMSPWSPNVVYDAERMVWSLFHVGYRRKANATNVFNMSGRIFRFDSEKKGISGIAGPYKKGEWLNIDKNPDWFEGSGEIVSFYPYQIGKDWWAFYGANSVPEFVDANGTTNPNSKNIFYAGLVKSEGGLTDKWVRQTALNPVKIDPEFVENSIITQVALDLYINVYDGANKQEISYSCSKDGKHWGKKQLIVIPNPPAWIKHMRTPLGLINEGNNIYTIYFTAFDGKNPEKIEPLWHDGFGNVGKMTVKLVR